MSDVWIAAIVGGVVGYALALMTIYIYRKFLTDVSIFSFLIDYLKDIMKKQFEDMFPKPPEKKNVDPPKI